MATAYSKSNSNWQNNISLEQSNRKDKSVLMNNKGEYRKEYEDSSQIVVEHLSKLLQEVITLRQLAASVHDETAADGQHCITSAICCWQR